MATKRPLCRRFCSTTPVQETYSLRSGSPANSRRNAWRFRRLGALCVAAIAFCWFLFYADSFGGSDSYSSSFQGLDSKGDQITTSFKTGNTKTEKAGASSPGTALKHPHLGQQLNSKQELPAAAVAPATSSPRQRKRYAYVFYLGGVPTLNKQGLKPNNKFGKPTSPPYRGLLFNILASIFSLRKGGSNADFIILVHMVRPYARLPQTDTRWLKDMGIIIQYLPPTPTSVVNELATLPLEKFRILQLSQYARVLYMDADIFPYCSLDYLLELSDDVFHNRTNYEHKHVQLKPNVVISIGHVPASSSIFVLEPGPDYFAQFLSIANYYTTSEYYVQFNKTLGWGQALNVTENDGWHAVSGKKSKKPLWSFPGADGDAGLLYHWTKYAAKKGVSIIVGDTIEDYQHGILINKRKESILQPFSCLSVDDEGTIGNQWYADEDVKSIMSPQGVAPYRDFAQWAHNSNKPWNYAVAPLRAAPHSSARRRWFAMLRKVDQRLTMGLGLNVKPQSTNVTSTGESTKAEIANWRYAPKQGPLRSVPLWSTSIHAMEMWAKRSSTKIEGGAHWFPPIFMESREDRFVGGSGAARTSRKRQLQMIANEDSTGDNHVSEPIRVAGSGDVLEDHRRLLDSNGEAGQNKRCKCSKQVSTDPCSSQSKSLDQWLENRFNLQVSKHRPLCPQGARHFIHIVIPFYQLDEATITTALCSAQCQDYPPELVRIYLYDDGSEDDALQNVCGPDDHFISFSPTPVGPVSRDKIQEILEMNPRSKTATRNVQCIQSQSHLGPGGAKYYAFLLVEAQADANDVVAVLDGDDLLLPHAFQRINEKYVDSECWFTYGTYEGKYSEQVMAIPRSMLNRTQIFNPRLNHPSWRFGHPRTFKAHLIRHLTYQDFAYNDKEWLVKATDRGFVYRMLELSGVDRIGYIKTPIYKYVWSSSTSTLAKVDKATRDGNLKHVQELQPSSRLELPIHVVLVCWGRIFLLGQQLEWMQEQTVTKTRQIHVHLLSNNPEKHGEIENIVRAFHQNQQINGNSKIVPLRVTIVKNEENWHAFSRFLYVADLRRTEPLDSVMFVDDDQYWPPGFIESLSSSHKPHGMTTWYGKTFLVRNMQTGLGDYWRSNITWSEIIRSQHTSVKTFTYGGPGGSIFPGSFWLFGQQLLRLKSDLKEYFEFDDVWVSYVMDGLLGWEHRRLPMPAPVDLANCDHKYYPKVLFRMLPKGQPQKLLELHNRTADRLKSVATYTGDSRTTKTTMFEQMQSRFHWDVLRPNEPPIPRIATPLDLFKVASTSVTPIKKATASGRAFVCITGQLERLELKNKIDHLLIPLRKAGYQVDVALVLTHGDASFTNFKRLKDLQLSDYQPFYSGLNEAALELSKADFTLVSPADNNSGTYQKLENPPINEQYVEGLYRAQTALRSREEQVERVKNHARIYDSYKRCNSYADHAARDPKFGGTPRSRKEDHYDVFIRIRDDAGFEKPISKKVMADLFPPRPNSVTVSGCRGWHGMNDRFAVVSPDAAKSYFLRPYDLYASKKKKLDGRLVINPETLLLHAYRSVNINVLAHYDLPGVHRVFRTPEGEAKFYEDDVTKPLCPNMDVSLQRSYELYAWTGYL